MRQRTDLSSSRLAALLGSLVLALAAGSRPAHADEGSGGPGWYAGIHLGYGDSQLGGGGIDGALASQGLVAGTSTSTHDLAYDLIAGYRFTPNFALEGGYVDLGRLTWTSTVTAPASDVASGDLHTHGLTLAAVGLLPLDHGVTLFGKLGAFQARSDFNANADLHNVALLPQSATRTRPLLGLGASYDLGNHLSADLEWSRYFSLGDAPTTSAYNVNLYMAGIAYHF